MDTHKPNCTEENGKINWAQCPTGRFLERWHILSWLDERLAISALWKYGTTKPVPVHKYSGWYSMGGLALFFFIIQCITGALLMIYYRPGPEAYSSVMQITNEVAYGHLIRSIHHWSANFMIAAVLLHMVSVFFLKSYRKPREFIWFTGLAMMGLTLVFGFSGYLLPWDELAFYATKIGLQIPEKIPVIGSVISNLVRGGTEVNEYTVQRFFTLHVFILPGILAVLMGIHLGLIQYLGISKPPCVLEEEERTKQPCKWVPFFPNFTLVELGIWLVSFSFLVFLAAWLPKEIGMQADITKPAPVGIHPEWFFMMPFQVLKIVPANVLGIDGELIGGAVVTGMMLVWGLLPFVDPTPKYKTASKIAFWIGTGIIAITVLLTIWAYIAVYSLKAGA